MACQIIEVLGFHYRTCLTYHHDKPMTAAGFRDATEHVLFATKGSMEILRPSARTDLPRWDEGPGRQGQRSSEFYGYIQTCSPKPRLRVFSDSNLDGWTTMDPEL